MGSNYHVIKEFWIVHDYSTGFEEIYFICKNCFHNHFHGNSKYSFNFFLENHLTLFHAQVHFNNLDFHEYLAMLQNCYCSKCRVAPLFTILQKRFCTWPTANENCYGLQASHTKVNGNVVYYKLYDDIKRLALSDEQL